MKCIELCNRSQKLWFLKVFSCHWKPVSKLHLNWVWYLFWHQRPFSQKSVFMIVYVIRALFYHSLFACFTDSFQNRLYRTVISFLHKFMKTFWVNFHPSRTQNQVKCCLNSSISMYVKMNPTCPLVINASNVVPPTWSS